MNSNAIKYNSEFMMNNETINELINSKNIFDNLMCGVCIKNLDGEVVYLNRYLKELLNDSKLYGEKERDKEIIKKEELE